MAKYMIVRDFDEWTANEVVDASEFVSTQRIRQLVDMRYLTMVAEPAQSAAPSKQTTKASAPKKSSRRT